MKTKSFLNRNLKYLFILLFIGILSCKNADKKTEAVVNEVKKEVATMAVDEKPYFKLSLAQWSFHKYVFGGGDPYLFAEKAKALGFTGLEYVNGLYKDLKEANYSDEAMNAFVERCNAEAKKHGMQNVLIMIDGQGNLAAADDKERDQTVENHKKWVIAAKKMGCHAIRVNLAGASDKDVWVEKSIDGLTKLGTFAKEHGINVIVENHGGLSSNGEMLAKVMKVATANLDNVGTLPDFGNFCIKNSKAGCEDMYDIYKGVTELMPYAKAVSAKSHDFDTDGNEDKIDYYKMMQIVKDAGYKGFVGVEYEGSKLSETDGIVATRDLILKASKQLK